MKYLGPNAYHEVKDPITGAISWQLDPTSKAIEYSDKDLQTWIEKDEVPHDLATFGLEEIRKSRDEWRAWQKFLEENPNATQEQKLEELSKHRKIPTKEEIEKGITLFNFLMDNHEKLKLALEVSKKPDMFSIPANSIMFSLLAMFAGKPERIPRLLLEKSHNERTPEEQEQAEKYLSEIFQTEQSYDFSEGKETIAAKRIALICDNQKVEGKAEINTSLFRHDISFREERLAIYIRRTFGAEGIRHLLGIIIGLEENFRQGHFKWSVNEHLERLGYRRKANGSFDPDLKRTASAIVKIFTGLCITSTRKDGKGESIKAKFLFMVEGFEIQTFEKEIIDEKIGLVATDFWYQNAFSPRDGQAPQYTKLLKEIVKENHREHPLTLYLVPLLAIFWRMNPERKFKVKNLMEWCDLDTKGNHRSDHLKDLESALDYMKNKNYLGEWTNNGKSKFPSQCEDPYECVLTFTPPKWLKSEFQLIEQRREMPALSQKQKILSQLEFIKIFEESGLKRKQFANSLGVTPQLITAIINGKRNITPETSAKAMLYMVQRKETDGNKIDPS
jgi:DNA-binding transcriptional regulator YiaG